MYSHLIETRDLFLPNKLLVCDIQVKEERLAFGKCCINSNKWMQLEQWLEFEDRLERILTSSYSTLRNLEEKTFYLSSAVRITIKSSVKHSTSYKRLIEKSRAGNILVLDIKIERVNIESLAEKNGEVKLTTLDYVKNNGLAKTGTEAGDYDLEYFPTSKKTKNSNQESTPYKPSTSTNQDASTENIIDEITEPYSPKPVYDTSDSSHNKIEDSPTNVDIPTYKPSRIRRNKEKLHAKASEENPKEKPNQKEESLIELQSARIELRTPNKTERTVKVSSSKKEILPAEPKSRSDTKNKISVKVESETLFGSSLSDQETTNKNSHESQSASSMCPKTRSNSETRSKRKKGSKTEDRGCSGEKKSMQGWLNKKQNVKKNIENKNDSVIATTRQLSPTTEILKKEMLHSMEENERQTEALRQLQEHLSKYKKPIPKKVDILNLNHLSADEVLSTFEKFQETLDDVFVQNRKKMKITGFNGIDHIKTISLLDTQKQLKMMSFLQNHYKPNEKGVPTLTKLFANAMLPEWIICVFMNEFNFTRDEALRRLDAQENYAVYLERDLDLSTF